MAEPAAARPPQRRVGLFVTCLVDLFRPSVGFAAVKLLEDAGCTVEVPRRRPAAASRPTIPATAPTRAAIAAQVIAAFEPFDYVVVPSGSCAGMIKTHYPELFADDPDWQPRAEALARARPTSWSSFLVDVLRRRRASTARFDGTVTYHDSCSGLRELGVKRQPRQLLASVEGLTLTEMARRRGLLRLRRHLLRQVSRDLRRHGRARRRPTSRRPAPTRCSPAISAACMNMAGKLQREGQPIAGAPRRRGAGRHDRRRRRSASRSAS